MTISYLFIKGYNEDKTTLQAWEIFVPNDETNNESHDHILIMELKGLEDTIRQSLKPIEGIDYN